MTRKHFQAIADVMKDNKPEPECEQDTSFISKAVQWDDTVKQMAYMCSTFNMNFDKDRFLEACGYGS